MASIDEEPESRGLGDKAQGPAGDNTPTWEPLPRRPALQSLEVGAFMLMFLLLLPWIREPLTESLEPVLGRLGVSPGPPDRFYSTFNAGVVVDLGLQWLMAAVLVLIVYLFERLSPARGLGLKRIDKHATTWILIVAASLLLGPVAILPVGVYVYRRHRRESVSAGSQMRVPRRDRDALWMVGAAVVGFILNSSLEVIARGIEIDRSLFADVRIGQKLLIIVTASVVEEIGFRGFLIERLHAILRRPWLSATISFVAFTALHIPNQGLAHVLTVTWIIAAGLTLAYMRTRNLSVCIIIHLLLNATTLITTGQ